MENDHGVLLDALDARVLGKPFRVLLTQLCGESIQRFGVHVEDVDAVTFFLIGHRARRFTVAQRHDVLTPNRSAHQVAEIGPDFTVFVLTRLRVDVIERDGAVRLDDEDVSIPLQSGDVRRVEFGNEAIDRCGEDVAHRVAETGLLGDFAFNVRPFLEHDDVVVGGGHCPHL